MQEANKNSCRVAGAAAATPVNGICIFPHIQVDFIITASAPLTPVLLLVLMLLQAKDMRKQRHHIAPAHLCRRHWAASTPCSTHSGVCAHLRINKTQFVAHSLSCWTDRVARVANSLFVLIAAANCCEECSRKWQATLLFTTCETKPGEARLFVLCDIR